MFFSKIFVHSQIIIYIEKYDKDICSSEQNVLIIIFKKIIIIILSHVDFIRIRFRGSHTHCLCDSDREQRLFRFLIVDRFLWFNCDLILFSSYR